MKKTTQKQSGKYVDGFVLMIKSKNIEAYKKMAQEASKVWMKHGALEYKECVGEDMQPNMGGHTPLLTFPKLTKLKPDEVVIFAYIVYKSRAHRDAVNKKVMAEMSKDADKYKDMEMPFDMKRMAYGGFQVLVDA